MAYIIDRSSRVKQEIAAATLAASDDAVTRRLIDGPPVAITVVIPTLNEALNLPHVLERMPAFVDEIVLVDGHSTDETIAVGQELRPDIRVVLQDGRGKGNALACGFAAAHGDIIVTLDADGSADPMEIGRFIAPLLEGHDFAKGSRFLPGGHSMDITRIRRTGNRVLLAALNLLYRKNYTDLCYGYNAFWRSCLPHMHVNCDGFEVETLITARVARAGLSVAEVPSVEHARLHGASNLRALQDGTRVLRTIVRERIGPGIERHDPNAWRPLVRELSQPRLSDMRERRAALSPSAAA
jgi:glycosyltransferase involved in cell wall biosynthesis